MNEDEKKNTTATTTEEEEEEYNLLFNRHFTHVSNNENIKQLILSLTHTYTLRH